ncbi:MAG: hypothetical protein AYL29_011730 [Candidatus Bathyarchaeota archaeon B24]|nr:MAG: hypothetical protein AYL29_011730 [Candidatus Bathyarchaeota archaeon B24]RLI24621.1 MAG: hypothetical protein DRO57_06175 [Candidatus Bathyarchaeota archaeon]
MLVWGLGDGAFMVKTIIAASTHNAKSPFNSWLKDIYNLGFRYLDVEFFRIIDESYCFKDGVVKIGRLKTDYLKELKQWVDKGLMQVVSFEAGSLYVDDEERLKKSITRVRKVVAEAESFKCPIVSVTPASFKKGISMDTVACCCKKLIDECSCYDVKLALENGEVGSIKILRKPEDIDYVLHKVGSPRLGFCLDVAAAATVDFDVSSYASKLLDYILVIHMNDITKDLRFKNLIIGLGDLEFKPLLAMVKPRRIPLVIEIYSGYSPIDLYLCRRQIEKLVKQVDC